MRRLGAFASLLLAAVASIATSMPPAPATSSAATFEVSLTADEPVEIRRATVTFTHDGNEPTGASVSVGSAAFDDFSTPHGSPPYRIDLVPTDPDEARADAFEASYEMLGWAYAAMDVLESCRHDCTRSYLVVTRLADPGAGPQTATLEARAQASYSGEPGEDPPSETEVAVEVGPVENLSLASLRATSSGTVLVGVDQPRSSWQGTLTVPAEGLTDQLQAPSLGSVWLTVTARPSDENARVSVDTRILDLYLLSELFDEGYKSSQTRHQWLGLCDDKENNGCSLPIALDFAWQPWEDSIGRLPTSGSVTLDWTLEATLEYIGLDDPPEGASLSLTPN